MSLPSVEKALKAGRSLVVLMMIVGLSVPATAASDVRAPRSDRSGQSEAAKDGAVEPSQETNRRRPARPNRDATASLSGRILDASSNSGVFDAVIVVQGRTVTADASGNFTITGLARGVTSVRIERWGYETTTRNITLASGSNSLGEVRLSPKSVVTLTEANGTTHRLDAESVDFATAAALSSYVILSPAEFCRTDGTIVTHDKSEIASIVGPGVPASGACCPASAPGIQVTVNLKSGASFPAILRTCEFYKYDFIGRSRDTGEWVYRNFVNIARIEFP
jgi:hypothetical protein